MNNCQAEYKNTLRYYNQSVLKLISLQRLG